MKNVKRKKGTKKSAELSECTAVPSCCPMCFVWCMYECVCELACESPIIYSGEIQIETAKNTEESCDVRRYEGHTPS
jgi:hypothetical protein